MTWFPDALVARDPVPTDLGLIVRPIWSSGSPLPVTIVGGLSFSGSLNLSASSDPTRPATDIHANVTASLASTVFLYGNVVRRMASVYNDSNRYLFLKVGDGASTGSFDIKMPPNSLYELTYPAYTGPITGVWGSGAGGNARVLELAP